MDQNQLLQARLAQLQKEGEAALTKETFEAGVSAMIKAGGIGNVKMHAFQDGTPATLDANQIIPREDAAERFIALARDQLINDASNGDQNAEREYAELRRRERVAYNLSKGR